MDGVSLLQTPVGFSLLDSLPPYDPSTVDALSMRLRQQGYDPNLIAAALTQQRLRARAAVKFGEHAASMLFTEAGLQQATRAVVADLHAARYVEAGCRAVADITCGLGADSLAFSRAGLAVTAVEFDQTTAGFARHNLAPFPKATVVFGDGLGVDFAQFDGVFADPARRSARGRTFNPADYSPPLDRVLAIREVVHALGVKIAPGIAYTDLPADVHAQWVSVDGDVVEAGLWFGPLGGSPGRSALVISGTQSVEIETAQDPRSEAVMVEPAPLGKYLYEPDGAVIRSGGLHVAADLLRAAPVSESIAYLTGDDLVDTPLARAFEVVDVMPIKALKSYLRARGVGSLEILKRGVDLDPDQFRKTLKLKGAGAATVILTRVLGKHSAIVCHRVGRRV